MGAFIGAEVEDAHVACSVGGDDFSLVRVDDYVVDGGGVGVIALNCAGARVPDFYGIVFGTGDHPFCVDVESNGCYVVGVAFEDHYWGGIGGFDVVEADDMAAGCGKVFLVGGYAETVDLRLGVLDCATAYTAQGFPKPNCVVIASCVESVSRWMGNSLYSEPAKEFERDCRMADIPVQRITLMVMYIPLLFVMICLSQSSTIRYVSSAIAQVSSP